MTTIHIHARDIVRHDAVGNFACQSALLAQSAGYVVRLWAENFGENCAPCSIESRKYFGESIQPDDLVFFNHSIHDPMLEDIIALPNRKLVYFHNITPPQFLSETDGRTAENCGRGLEQRRLLAAFDGILANSRATADCLLEGFDPVERARWQGRVVVCPPLIHADRWKQVKACDLPASPERRHILYVGRLVANKGILELLEVLDDLSANMPDIAVDIVGGPPDGAYFETLTQRVRQTEETFGVPFSFYHGISDGLLKALYQRSTACITHSKHEGFCIPALDALAFDKPMFTPPLPAVLELLGQAALPLPDDDRRKAALMIERFLNHGDHAAHARLRQERFGQLRLLANGDLLLQAINDLGAA